MELHSITNVPEKVLQVERVGNVTFSQKLCLLVAIKLYELGRLSSGRPAELAGMSRVEFLNVLGKYQVFPIESELNDLESCYA